MLRGVQMVLGMEDRKPAGAGRRRGAICLVQSVCARVEVCYALCFVLLRGLSVFEACIAVVKAVSLR